MNSIVTIEKHIYNSFINAYTIDNIYYNARIINDIIYNEKSHIVAKFKDYLIIDDISEFLKRFYTSSESLIRLPKFFEYYETYSRIFPNYTALPESKFIYKNIHKKQKMIDKQQNMEMSMEKLKQKNKNNKDNNIDNNNVFNTEICCSIAEDSSLINEVFGMDKIKKKKKKKGNDINSVNSNSNNNKSNNTSVDNKSVFEILKLINNIDVKQNRTKSQGHHHALAISGNPSTVVQKEKRFTKQIKLHINETKRKGSNNKRSINNNNSNNNSKPKTNNISKIKEGINNSVTNPKHRSTISSLLPKSKIDTYFFKNLTMNIFNEIHLNNSPIINNTINHSTSLFNNHNHTKSSNNIKNKCIFPFTYRNNNIKSETKTIKNIEAELIKNKIKKHSKTKTHHNRNRNCVISSNTKGQTQYNSEIIIGNIINNNNNNTATHFRNSLSFINNNNHHNSHTPSSKCNVVNYKNIPNKKTILTNEKYFIDKFKKEFQTQKHFRHRSNETLLKNNNSSRLQTDRSKNKVDVISLNKIMYQSNSNIKHNIQQPLTIGGCVKKGRNNRNTNYTFRTNNVTNDNKKGMLLRSKDNYLFSNKITSPKEKTIIKGITVNNFSKVIDVHKSKSNNKAKTDRRNSNGYAKKKK